MVVVRRATIAVLASLLPLASLAACSPDEVGPPSGTPSVTEPMSPSAAPSSESEVDVDYAAAEKAYRLNRSELSRLYIEGGAQQPTEILTATSTGAYLKLLTTSLKTAKSQGLRTSEGAQIVGVSRVGWSPSRISLTACEDSSAVRILDRNNKDVTPSSSRRYLQELTVTKSAGNWKVSDATSQQVDNFDDRECGS